MTPAVQALIRRWQDRANEKASEAGRWGATLSGQISRHEAAAIQECTRELIFTLIPPMGCPDPRESETGV